MASYSGDQGQRGRILAAGRALQSQLRDNITTASLSLSNSQTSQLVFAVADPDLELMRGDKLAKGTSIGFGGLKLEIAVRELVVSGATPAVQLTARARGVQVMRRSTGARVWRGQSADQWVRAVGQAAGMDVVAQQTPGRRVIRRGGHDARDESDWDVFQRLCQDHGYIGYESEAVLYFGQPTWLAQRLNSIDVVWRGRGRDPDPDSLIAVPLVRDSDDDTANGVTGSLSITPGGAERFTPSKAIDLVGLGPYDRRYLVTATTLNLDGVTPATVSFAEPVNPEVPKDSGGGRYAGSRKLGDLLRYVGFTGHGWEVACGVVWPESNVDAHAIGDVALEDATWGPSVGLFQIRSLRNPPAHGSDSLRNAQKLRDAIFNAKAAYTISQKGTNWTPWSTFNSGAYREHLGDGDVVIAHFDGIPGTAGGGGSGGDGTSDGDVWPTTSTRISTPYHEPGDWAAGYHTGVDIDGDCGDLIWSATHGDVVESTYNGHWGSDYGYHVVVRHKGHDLGYCHLTTTPLVSVGDVVRPGTRLGHMGETGRAFGCHLHFEVRTGGGDYGDDVDPMKWLPRRDTPPPTGGGTG